VDPYYLSHLAQKVGLHPQVVLAGRDTNDAMGAWIADRLHDRRGGQAGRALVMGLTFKENVPDLRNSRVADIVARLEALGYDVALTDPIANGAEAARDYGRAPIAIGDANYDLVVAAVAHDEYRALSPDTLAGMVAEGGTLADLKGIWRGRELPASIDRWAL
jgi:UDP-N-acetyl-D-galactosamine dehydrogenase